jgi:DNA-binding PadR family transcriptional regulator
VTGPLGTVEDFRRRLVGLYALTLMEREGGVYGYRVSERIAERTEGNWRPGPGAVYPALSQLVRSGFARARTRGRRREYTITPAGRKLLLRVRQGPDRFQRARVDLAPLWAEVLGSPDVGELHLLNLRRALTRLEAFLDRPGEDPRRRGRLLEAVHAELASALRRITAAYGQGALPVPRRAHA